MQVGVYERVKVGSWAYEKMGVGAYTERDGAELHSMCIIA
jgi:hypothetical protein